ncbi:MAG: hypothetical protein CMN30_12910 [Sandaracinus sp.]|nr:hypothetical protein [Sandaracinus sp.]|tara:strand:+ start:1492 stop:2304 length:813 start_codon:yes stop_codon:yes gene_type:complete
MRLVPQVVGVMTSMLFVIGCDDGRSRPDDVYRFDPNAPMDAGPDVRRDAEVPVDASPVPRDASDGGPGGMGASCAADGQCMAPLVCRAGRCTALASEGQPCSDDASCQPDLSCLSGACRAQVCSTPTSGSCQLRVPAGSFGPLTAPCLPRCSAETAAAYRACDSNACRNAAVDADSTPSKAYTIGTVPVNPGLDCLSCVSYQEFHCFSLVCGDEVDSYVDECIAGIDDFRCDDALFRLDLCLAALTPTQQATLETCMLSADGPPGCFACP